MKYAAILAALTMGLFGGHAIAADNSADRPADRPAEPVPLQAEASLAAEADIIVLHGTNEGKGLDEKIGEKVAKKLKKPPFSAYDSYVLLEEKQLSFGKEEAGEMELPDGGKLALKLNDIKKKVDLQVTITKSNKKKFVEANVKASMGKTFFLAGPKHKKGILVLGLTLKPKSAPEKKKK